MPRNTGSPSTTHDQKGTGIPSKLTTDDVERTEEMTEKYTDDDRDIADGVRTNNPNRNTDKDDATNAGGYRN